MAADSAVIPLAAPTGFSANGFEADGFAYEEEACAGSEPEDWDEFWERALDSRDEFVEPLWTYYCS